MKGARESTAEHGGAVGGKGVLITPVFIVVRNQTSSRM
jgi:hypothetical protein